MGLGGLFEGEWAKAHLLNVLNHFPGVNAWAREILSEAKALLSCSALR